MAGPVSADRRRLHRTVAAAVPLAILVLAAIVSVPAGVAPSGATLDRDPGPGATRSTTPSAAPTAAATSTATVSTFAKSDIVPFGVDSSYQWDNGVTASILSAERFTPSDTADGLVDGDAAVRIVIKVTNGSIDPLDVGGTVVNVKTGADGEQAEAVSDIVNGIDTGLDGVIAPGHSATAPYGFAIPRDNLGQVDVEVAPDYNYDSAIFEGTVG